MKEEPVLSNITIYPVKSLDGMAVQKAVITEGGCLLHDREYAMSDENGNLITGKSNVRVHSLRSTFDIDNKTISLRPMDDTNWTTFYLEKEKAAIQSYLTEYFGMKIQWHQNKTGRFMDIPDISGVTVLSTASLQEISVWFNNMPITETRKRFRATLEIEGVPAFWEDHLFRKEGIGIEFKVGNVKMIGMSPRARCIVPTRNPETAEAIHGFPKSFSKHRASTLPSWSALNDFGHHYYLTVNCYIPATEIGKTIEKGNEINIIGEKIFY